MKGWRMQFPIGAEKALFFGDLLVWGRTIVIFVIVIGWNIGMFQYGMAFSFFSSGIVFGMLLKVLDIEGEIASFASKRSLCWDGHKWPPPSRQREVR